MIDQISHRRIASVAGVLALVGSCAVVIAVQDKPLPASTAYKAWPAPSASHRMLAVRQTRPMRHGLQLLMAAAAACRTIAYSGIQASNWWAAGRPSTSVIDVWHRPGSAMVAQLQVNPAGAEADAPNPGSAAQDPGVTLGLSPRQLVLMQAHYVITYAGPGSVDGRSAEVVAVVRPDGTLAARYWVDGQTKLPLRRELFDDSARMVSEIGFTELRLGRGALGGMPPVGAQPETQELTESTVSGLRAEGWPLPEQLAGGLELLTASELPAKAGPVIDMSFSDGLSAVSLFVQRGELPGVMKGWQRISIDGRGAYASDPDDRTIAWSANGFVYTLIADAPAESVDLAVAGLQHSAPISLGTRITRGLRRLASWANPFR